MCQESWEGKCAIGIVPKVLGSPRRVIPDARQSSRSILRFQEVGIMLLLIAVRRESSWNLLIPVNKAVAKLSKRHVVFLQHESQWEKKPAKTYKISLLLFTPFGMNATARQSSYRCGSYHGCISGALKYWGLLKYLFLGPTLNLGFSDLGWPLATGILHTR